MYPLKTVSCQAFVGGSSLLLTSARSKDSFVLLSVHAHSFPNRSGSISSHLFRDYFIGDRLKLATSYTGPQPLAVLARHIFLGGKLAEAMTS